MRFDARLIGPLSIDRYLDSGHDRPGGGALNMAFHWTRLNLHFELVSRIATSHRETFEDFIDRHGITTTPDLVTDGEACSIDVRIALDRQPEMDNFVEGVMADFGFTDAEAERVVDATPTHLVLVDVIDAELHRLAVNHGLDDASLTGDFLSLRHFSPPRFAATLAHLDVGFIGWPGNSNDAAIGTLRKVAEDTRSLLVITFGSQGIRAIDGRSGRPRDRWFDVDAVEVAGTTLGCGDAFIAGFLAEWFGAERLDTAIDAGRAAGAAATGWFGPLPDDAYG